MLSFQQPFQMQTQSMFDQYATIMNEYEQYVSDW